MATLTLKVHQSLWIEGENKQFIGDFEGVTIIEAMNSLLDKSPKLKDLCLLNNNRRPGILYISGKTELSSLGLLDEILDTDLEIRVIPILHGG